MNIKEVSVPEVYKEESADFRFFLEWFTQCLQRLQYDIENLIDLYDPLRCPSWLLWMLADTMGFKYDDRLPASYNRLVLIYFMSMIKLKGSKNGVTLAAEVNLAQFNILKYCEEKEILADRLEDTSVPVNSVYVAPNVELGYIDVVYYSEKRPIDACIEYVRPLGMYLFQHAGVHADARTKLSVDARLTNLKEMSVSIGPTHIGHYSREDYARMQKMINEDGTYTDENKDVWSAMKLRESHKRRKVWNRNKELEGEPSKFIDPGYRSLYSLQLCNNEHIVKSLIPNLPYDPDNGRIDPGKIFSIGYGPQTDSKQYPDDYLDPVYQDKPLWNLRYNRQVEESISPDIYTLDPARTSTVTAPKPAVNPIMSRVGDAMSKDVNHNEKYYEWKDGKLK